MKRKDILASGTARSATFMGGSGENDIFRNVAPEGSRDESIPDIEPVKVVRKKFVPTEGVLLVRRDEARSASGILITETMEKEQPAEGIVLEVGFGSGFEVGQHIVFGKYAGAEFKLNGETLLLMNEDEVKGFIIDESPVEEGKSLSRNSVSPASHEHRSHPCQNQTYPPSSARSKRVGRLPSDVRSTNSSRLRTLPHSTSWTCSMRRRPRTTTLAGDSRSFSKYAKSLDIKYSKAYYLVNIREKMLAAGLERVQYEPVGLGKLRVIARLKPDTEYQGTPVSLLIRELTLKAGTMSQEEIQFEVDTIMGLTADESMVWINIKVKKLARENVIKVAFEKMKKHLGTVPDETEAEGQHKDASDGRALEMICANFLADPNYDTPEAAVSPSGETGQSGETDNPTPEDEVNAEDQ